nr:hypothetical protein [Tanacetum cinerariifolium]
MAYSLSHTDSEVEALVQKVIDEDKGRQNAILDLALQFENSCTIEDDLRNAYEKCTHISQEILIDTFLKEGSDKDYELNLYMYEKAAKLEKQMDAKLAWLLEKYYYRSETHIGETLEEQAMDEKARNEKIRQKQAEADEFFLEFEMVRYDSEYESSENEPWEFSLDIDDFDLHLTPVVRSSSSTHVEPSRYTPNPVRIIPGHAGIVQLSSSTRVEPSLSTSNPVWIIPGPAGIVQQAKLLKEKLFILDSDGALMSTQQYMQKIIEDDAFNSGVWVSATNYVNAFGGTVTGCLGDIDNFLKRGKLEQVVATVKSCSSNMLGYLNVTLKDLSGTIPDSIHYKVLDMGSYKKDITVGAAMILANVSVFTPKPLQHYLNITK